MTVESNNAITLVLVYFVVGSIKCQVITQGKGRYWRWFNQQIKLPIETKCGIDLGLCHEMLFSK